MTINYQKALVEMRHRRQGIDPVSILKEELYESRGKNDATKYTLGGMQELDPEYTRISIEEGDRVKSHLLTSLATEVTFRYQGSVPLNTHIRKSSDIDLLVIHGGFFVYDTTGIKSASYEGGYDGLAAMCMLRKNCEESLKSRYYAATVDTSGAKSITLSGGSFRRKIDVVPSNWYDTKSYQEYQHDYFRDIQVLDKYERKRITNSPFRFIHEVQAKDDNVQGGAKKVIRMLKNIKNDSSQNVNLSTYDITSLIWNMPNEKLDVPIYRELALLGNTQEYLDYLYHNENHAKSLRTPDDSRFILDTTEKIAGLKQLSYEVNALAKAVHKELFPSYDNPVYTTVRNCLAAQSI